MSQRLKGRYPSDEELDNCVHLVMTNPTWDPAEGTDAEEAAMDRAILPVTSDRTPITSQRVATLSKRWALKPDLVEMTLGATTQLASRIWDEPRFGRYGHKFRLLGRKRLSSRFFTDTFFCKKSLSGFTCVQVFINSLTTCLLYTLPTCVQREKHPLLSECSLMMSMGKDCLVKKFASINPLNHSGSSYKKSKAERSDNNPTYLEVVMCHTTSSDCFVTTALRM